MVALQLIPNGTMFDGIATFLEKLPNFALKSGIALVLMGISLKVGMSVGAIEASAFDGTAAQVAPALIFGGGGLVVAGVLFGLPSAFSWVRNNFAQRGASKERKKRLLGNLILLNPEERLVLFSLLHAPDGRFEANPNWAPLEKISRFGLIQSEIPGLWFSAAPHGIVRIAPEIFAIRDTIIAEYGPHLSEHFGADVTDEKSRFDILKKLDEERGTGRL